MFLVSVCVVINWSSVLFGMLWEGKWEWVRFNVSLSDLDPSPRHTIIGTSTSPHSHPSLNHTPNLTALPHRPAWLNPTQPTPALHTTPTTTIVCCGVVWGEGYDPCLWGGGGESWRSPLRWLELTMSKKYCQNTTGPCKADGTLAKLGEHTTNQGARRWQQMPTHSCPR